MGGGLDHKLATQPSTNISLYRARDKVLKQKMMKQREGKSYKKIDPTAFSCNLFGI